jgi:hypothetical protein
MTETTNVEINWTVLRENNRKPCKSNMEATLLSAIDESLSSFGDSFKQVIYFQLANTYHIKKQEIPDKIDEFADAIEEIFGIGAKLIEMKIIKTVYEKVAGFTYIADKKDLIFTEYIENLRRFL